MKIQALLTFLVVDDLSNVFNNKISLEGHEMSWSHRNSNNHIIVKKSKLYKRQTDSRDCKALRPQPQLVVLNGSTFAHKRCCSRLFPHCFPAGQEAGSHST